MLEPRKERQGSISLSPVLDVDLRFGPMSDLHALMAEICWTVLRDLKPRSLMWWSRHGFSQEDRRYRAAQRGGHGQKRRRHRDRGRCCRVPPERHVPGGTG